MIVEDIIKGLKESKSYPAFRVGDTLRVHVKIREGEKERVQVFEGIVIKQRGRSQKEGSFTVRKLSYGVGVERIFPYESPSIDKIEIKKQGDVRRAALFYLRGRKGRAAQVGELDRDAVASAGPDATKAPDVISASNNKESQ